MSIVVLGPSMKPVTSDTWLWWKRWCPGEPCWTRLAMRTILPFMMRLETDTSPSPNYSCSSGPHGTYCKSTLFINNNDRWVAHHVILFACFNLLWWSFKLGQPSNVVHLPHTRVFRTSEISNDLWHFVCQYLWFWNFVDLTCVRPALSRTGAWKQTWSGKCLEHSGLERCFSIVCWIRCAWLFWPKIKPISPNSASEKLEKQFSSATCCNSQPDSTVRSHW